MASTIDALLSRLQHLMKVGPEAIADACRITRELGLKGLSVSHLPDDWSKRKGEHLVWRAGLFSEIPEGEFEKWLKFGVKSLGFCVNTIRSQAQRWRAERLQAERELKSTSEEGIEIYLADIFKVKSLKLGEAAAVITDPPYERSALPLWRELIRFSDRVLSEHGWLIAMSGQRWLPQVFSEIEEGRKGTSMRYCWTMAIHMPGAESSQGWIGLRNPLNIEWKPVLIYSKGEPTDWPTGLRDFIVSEGRDKSHHEQGQSLGVFQKLVKGFVEPGDLVSDPFLGGGTTAVAAHFSGRAFEGSDIEKNCVTETTERIQLSRICSECGEVFLREAKRGPKCLSCQGL